MRILDQDLKKGYIEVMLENDDDLWVLYNVIEPGDIVTAKTTREVKFGEGGSSRRIPMVLSIKVKKLEFQPFTDRLRIRGVVVEGPEEYGIKGKYHTLNITPGSRLVIWKNKWFKHQLDRLTKTSSVRSPVLIVVLDYDEACIALLGEQGVKVLDELSSNLPGKDDPKGFTTYLNRYLEETVKRISEEAERYDAKVIVVASPGDLAKHVVKLIREKKLGFNKIYQDSVSIGGCNGLNEILRRDSVKKAVEEISIIKAQEIVEEFKQLLVKEPLLTAYGVNDIEYAIKNNAVEKMVVSSGLIRSYDEDMRRKINELLEEAYRRKARIIIVPSNSDVGREVEGFGGIIAILRYPLPRPNAL